MAWILPDQVTYMFLAQNETILGEHYSAACFDYILFASMWLESKYRIVNNNLEAIRCLLKSASNILWGGVSGING